MWQPLFVDIKGAFDNVWWPALACRLSELNLPEKLLKVLLNCLDERTVHLNTSNCTQAKTLTKGFPQGSILGPTLWNLCMDAFLSADPEAPMEKVAYADDVANIVSAQNRRELEMRLREVTMEIERWTDAQKLELSTQKFVYMLLKGKLHRNPIVRLNNDTIRRATVVKYLGVHLDSNLRYDYPIQQTKIRAMKMLQSLRIHARRKWGIPPRSIRQIYERAILPMMTYGIEVWGTGCQ